MEWRKREKKRQGVCATAKYPARLWNTLLQSVNNAETLNILCTFDKEYGKTKFIICMYIVIKFD